ncbi:MAG: hypothetical protein IPN94_26335 [Sphingobacteriales bacterium]|nr:hypothetical protein [Sphingobacteriales bacterium]
MYKLPINTWLLTNKILLITLIFKTICYDPGSREQAYLCMQLPWVSPRKKDRNVWQDIPAIVLTCRQHYQTTRLYKAVKSKPKTQRYCPDKGSRDKPWQTKYYFSRGHGKPNARRKLPIRKNPEITATPVLPTERHLAKEQAEIIWDKDRTCHPTPTMD